MRCWEIGKCKGVENEHTKQKCKRYSKCYKILKELVMGF